MKKFFWLGAVLLSCVVGCAMGQKGLAVVTFDKARPPILQEATADGEYALYDSMAGDPIATFLLHQGDPLGFKPSTTGQVIAVAGEREIPIPADKGYSWKRR
jgi:hypothetical protein